MAGEHNDGAVLKKQVQGFGHVLQANVTKGGVDLDQSWCVKDLDDQHAQMAHAVPGSAFDPAVGGVGAVDQSQVVQGPAGPARTHNIGHVAE